MTAMTHTQLDIAPTISKLLHFEIPDKDGEEITEIISYCAGKVIDQILLVVVDGVGTTLYRKLNGTLRHLQSISETGLFLEIHSLPPRITTPNIATILTGYTPEHHRLYEVADTFYTRVKSILEIASDNGIKSGIVIELLGAKAQLNRVDLAIGIENLHGIIDYDRRIVDLGLKAFSREGIQLLMIHLRAIDNCAHHFAQSWEDLVFSAQTIDENVERICRSLRKSTLVLITSDHPLHVKKWAHLEDGSIDVPLIAGYVDVSAQEKKPEGR